MGYYNPIFAMGLKAFAREAKRVGVDGVLVVDANLVQGVSMDALGDYIAFVALLQADPNGNTTGIDTVMNLFRSDIGDKRPTGMTDWDRDFLRALYSMPRNTVSMTQAQSYLAERMERD